MNNWSPSETIAMAKGHTALWESCLRGSSPYQREYELTGNSSTVAGTDNGVTAIDWNPNID